MASMTAAQKRSQAKRDYDAFLAGCPSRQLLDRISDKWVALVLAALGDGGPDPGSDCAGEPRAMRYSKLSRRLAGVSQKMLTQTLRSLERDGLLTRTVTPTVPVTVTYELTELGSSPQDVMRGVKAWAEAHMDEVLTNRERYVDRAAGDERGPVPTSGGQTPSSGVHGVRRGSQPGTARR
jgi:DNA-binding HxlR family transcriptional regulator